MADEYPWPPVNGYRMRLANVVEALGAVGDVDGLWVSSDPRGVPAVPPPPGLLRRVVTVPAVLRPRTGAVARWLAGRLPRRVVWLDWRAARRAAEGFEEHYDVVWCSHADTWLALHDTLPAGRTVVDLDNLEDEKLVQRRRVLHSRRDRRWPGLRPAASRAADAVDRRRWRRQQRRIATTADAVVVCSELDRRRLGVPGAAVVPNGYDPRPPRGPRPPGPPTVTMIGLLTYEPNLDGARAFVDEALPRLRAQVPEVQLRLVGRHDGLLDDLASRDGIVVTGELETLDDELRRADVIVVPVRFGGGTRLKVLEGFASHIPVVSTTVGCEGLAVTPGVHLLVADDGPGLADACARLLADPAASSALAASAHSLLCGAYRWEPIRDRVRTLVAELTGAGAGVGGP